MKYRLVASLIIILVVTLCVTVLAAEYKWKKFGQGGYTVQMPGKPTCTSSIDTTHGFHIVEHTCVFNAPDLSVTAEYSDLPGIARTFEGKKGIYKKSARAFLSNVGGSQTSAPSMMVGGQPGLELNYVTSSRIGTARFVMVKDRLYVVQASVPKGKSQADATKYLDSFSL